MTAVVIIVVVAVIVLGVIVYLGSRGGGISHDAGIRYAATSAPAPRKELVIDRPEGVGQHGSFVVFVVTSAPGVAIAPTIPPAGWTRVLSTAPAAIAGLRIDSFTVLGDSVRDAGSFRFLLNATPAGGSVTPGVPVAASATIVWIQRGADLLASAADATAPVAPALASSSSNAYRLAVFAAQTFAPIAVAGAGRSAPAHWVLTNPKSGDELEGHTHVVSLDTIPGGDAIPAIAATRAADASGAAIAQSILVQSFDYL